MPASRDPRPRPQSLLPTRDPRPRPSAGLRPSTTRSVRPQKDSPTNLSAPIQIHPEISSTSLPSPSSPSEGCSQIVAMGPRSSEHNWLTREDLQKLPKIPKIKCGAKAASTAPSVLEPKLTFTVSTPATQMPMTPPECPLEFEQRLNSETTKRPCASPSAMQSETGTTMTTIPKYSSSTGPDSTQPMPTNGPFCSESSPVFSLPITPPLTLTLDFTSPSLSRNLGTSLPSSMKSSTQIQERDRLDMPRGRNGVQSILQSEVKEIKEPPRTQNTILHLQGTSPLKDARKISSPSHVQRSSPLACTVTDSSGRTTQRVANSPHTPITPAQQARSSKEFNMDSYNSCDCRSNGGQECMFCRILKGAFEFCKQVDRMVKER